MNRLGRLWRGVRGSLWFLPGLIVSGAVLLATILIWVDTSVADDALARWPRLFGAGASGARGMLQAIASAMVTIAGVAFSITLVALSLASSQYTSRVLRTFMDDRVNQSVLGVLMGIFAYCLVALRTIRGGDEGAFVPSLTVVVAVLLALLGVGCFILFIHHISTSIQVSHILARIERATNAAVDALFPEEVGDEAPDDANVLTTQGDRWHAVHARRSGYVREVDADELVAIASEHDVIIRMERSVGDFVVAGTALASIAGAPLADDVVARLETAYAIGDERTVDQDAAYGINQIVDIALKALSPGINDTTTAVMCVDRLTAILSRVAARRIPSPMRTTDGALRVIASGPTFASLVDSALSPIRLNAESNVATLARLLWSVGTIRDFTTSVVRRSVLDHHRSALVEVITRTVPSRDDRERLLAGDA